MTMRLANMLLLHDCQTQLGGAEGLWHEGWHNAGTVQFMEGWYARVRMLMGDETLMTFFDENGDSESKFVRHEFPNRSPVIQFLYSEANNFPVNGADIWCDVLGPNMLEIEAVLSDGRAKRTYRFTYCGTFSIWWATGDDGEYICKQQ